MWNRKKKKSKKGKSIMNSSAADKVNTIIGEETQLNGNIEHKGSIVVYGKVKGNISTNASITVGKEGSVEGDLVGKNITLSGQVNGNVTAKSKLTLKKKACLLGDVKAQKIVIDDGATFEGKCDMNMSKTSTSSEESK